MDPLEHLLCFDSTIPWRFEPPPGIAGRLAPFDRERERSVDPDGTPPRDEVIAAAQLAGALVLRDDAAAFLTAARAPASRNERLLANAERSLSRILASAGEELDIPALEAFHRDLLARIEPDAEVGRLRRRGERPRCDEVAGVRTGGVADAAEWAPRLCKVANARNGDRPYVHPVLKALAIHAAVHVAAPFAVGNASLARLLLLRQLLSDGYSAFRTLPLFSALLFAPDRVTHALEDCLMRHDAGPALACGLDVLDRARRLAARKESSPQ